MAVGGKTADTGSQPRWPMYRGNPQRTVQSPFKVPLPMRVKWEVNLKREICALLAIGADGSIYVGAGARFYAITPSGQVLWVHDFSASGRTTPPKRGSSCGDNQAFTSPSPVLAPNGTLYIGSADGTGRDVSWRWIPARMSGNASSGRSRPTGRCASPVVAGGVCFIGDAMAVALESNGKRKWTGEKAEFTAVTSSPAPSKDGKRLYVGGVDGRLHALDAVNGKEQWTAGPEQKSVIRLPIWDAQGRQLTGFTTGGYIPEAPSVGSDGTIYWSSWNGHLYAATPDGKLRWALGLKDHVTSTAAVSADGHVLVCTYGGQLCCVRVTAVEPALQ